MRRAPLALALLVAACGRRVGAPVYELREVVASAIARLEAEVRPADGAGEDADARDALAAVLGPLRSDDADLRALAVEDARNLPPAAAERAAQALLDAAEPAATRVALADVLGALGTPRALEALAAGLAGARESEVRARCAHRLGQAGDDRGVPRLLQRLKHEEDLDVVLAIVDALARHGHLAGVEALVVVWSRAQGETRALAATRLDEIAREHGCGDVDTLRARWREGRLPARARPSPALVLEGWRWIARLAEWQLRGVDDARYVLVGLEDWIVPLLAAALRDENVYVRVHAAQCLERRGARAAAAVAELEAALAEPRVAPTAASALAALGAAPAAPALERAAGTSTDPELRVAATRALGTLGLPRSLPVLERVFAEARSPDLRQAAAEALLVLAPGHAAFGVVRDCLLDEHADAGAAELALEIWLERQRASRPELGPQLERWNALAAPAGEVPSAAQVADRRRARAEILRALAR